MGGLKSKIYWKYFCYIIEHKWNVGIECLKMGMPLHALTHDISKFLPSEFFPYALFFYSKDKIKTDKSKHNFQKGWCLHQKRNIHHWNYWVSIERKNKIIPIPMPKKYVKQMVADWNGMSRKFGGKTIEYFNKNKNDMILHNDTIEIIERILNE